MTDLTQERLKEVLRYNEDTGVFTWLSTTSTKISIGDEAGHLNANGYISIRVDGTLYQAHRLAILYYTGGWPPEMVDHEDGDKANNSLLNLRLASRSENHRNTSKGQLTKAE